MPNLIRNRLPSGFAGRGPIGRNPEAVSIHRNATFGVAASIVEDQDVSKMETRARRQQPVSRRLVLILDHTV
jgi:hypothetical protein